MRYGESTHGQAPAHPDPITTTLLTRCRAIGARACCASHVEERGASPPARNELGKGREQGVISCGMVEMRKRSVAEEEGKERR